MLQITYWNGGAFQKSVTLRAGVGQSCAGIGESGQHHRSRLRAPVDVICLNFRSLLFEVDLRGQSRRGCILDRCADWCFSMC